MTMNGGVVLKKLYLKLPTGLGAISDNWRPRTGTCTLTEVDKLFCEQCDDFYDSQFWFTLNEPYSSGDNNAELYSDNLNQHRVGSTTIVFGTPDPAWRFTINDNLELGDLILGLHTEENLVFTTEGEDNNPIMTPAWIEQNGVSFAPTGDLNPELLGLLTPTVLTL